MFNDFAKRARNGEFKGSDLYQKILESKYKNLRTANYTDIPMGIDSITEKGGNGIKVINENGWHYRAPINGTTKSKYRISINANGSRELIEKLDVLVNKGCYYKTPNSAADWACRHDPITIYLVEKPTKEFIDNLVYMLNNTNSIRSKADVLIGKKLSDGVCILEEPTSAGVETLLEECRKISPDFYEGAKNTVTFNNGRYKCSAGQYYVIEDLLKSINK